MKGTKETPGIIPLSIRDIFHTISQIQDRKFQLRVSYLEIYNEVIIDLLDPDNQSLKIREDFVNNRGVYVSGAKEEQVSSIEEMLGLMEKGENYRHFGSTNMNERSSRSHTIFRIMIESMDASVACKALEDDDFDIFASGVETSVLCSTLNLVDLAGSERVSNTLAEGQRLKEGGHINKSLLTLGNVIAKLSEGSSSHIPYRDSKLTRILSPALGGNSKTAIICTVTPALQHFEETHSTLKFANRAKSIQNNVTVNEILNEKALIKKLKRENDEWKEKFQQRVNHVEDEISRIETEKEDIIKTYEETLKIQGNEKDGLNQEILSLKKLLLEKERDTEWIQTIARSDKQKFEEDLNLLQKNLTTLKVEHEEALKNMQLTHESTLMELKNNFTKQFEVLKQDHLKELQDRELVTNNQIGALEDAISQITNQNSELKQQVDSMEQTIKELNSIKSHLEEDIQNLNENKKDALQTIEETNMELSANIENLSTQNLKLRTQIQTLEQQAKDHEEYKDHLEETVKELANQNQSLQQQVQLLQDKIQEEEEMRENQLHYQIKQDTDLYLQEITSLKEQILLMQDGHSKEKDLLSGTIESLSEALQEKDVQIDQIVLEQAELRATNQSCSEKTLIDLEEVIKQRDITIQELQTEIEMKEQMFKKEMDEAIERIRELEQDKNVILVGVTDKYEEISRMQVENKSLAQENAELKSKIQLGKAKAKKLLEDRKRKEQPNHDDLVSNETDKKKIKFTLDEDKENKIN